MYENRFLVTATYFSSRASNANCEVKTGLESVWSCLISIDRKTHLEKFDYDTLLVKCCSLLCCPCLLKSSS